MIRRSLCFLLFAALALLQARPATAQVQAAKYQSGLANELRALVETPAVSGHEQAVTSQITGLLAGHHPQTDNLGNVIVTLGSGAPHRLIVAPVDEPGFIVGGINGRGYLTLQRLPQGGNLPLFNELYSAEPVKIETAQHGWINGAVAGISIHLLPQREHPPNMAELDNMYVDVGATTAAEARASGADVLSPLAIDRRFYEMANGQWTSPAIGDRFGVAALLEVVRHLDPAKIKGTLTIAFVTQQWLGARGLQRVIESQKPDELIYVGRLVRPPALPRVAAASASEGGPIFSVQPGSGVLIATERTEGNLTGLPAELKQLAAEHNINLKTDVSAPLLPRGGYLPQPKLPVRTVHLAVATAWPSTPAEFIDGHDVASVIELLEDYLQGAAAKIELAPAHGLAEPLPPTKPGSPPSNAAILKSLVETYGASSHE
ncbi:MAG: M20/M25/M40 family metallo-hydrolase, partial [Candidatus Angelobacter sp.]